MTRPARGGPRYLGLACTLLLGCPEAQDTATSHDEPLLLTQAHNYTVSVGNTVFEVREDAELCFDWTGLAALDPAYAEIDGLYLLNMNLPPECVLWQIAAGEINQFDISGYFYADEVNGTRLCLEDLAELQSPGLSCESGTSWLLYLALQDSWVEVAVLDSCSGGSLQEVLIDHVPTQPGDLLTVDTTQAERLEAPAGSVPTLDWFALGADGLGQSIEPGQIRTLRVARFDAAIGDLQENFVGVWDAPVESFEAGVAWLSSADLRSAKDEDDQHFGGFTTEDTWLVSLEADKCPPLGMAVVEVDGQ